MRHAAVLSFVALALAGCATPGPPHGSRDVQRGWRRGSGERRELDGMHGPSAGFRRTFISPMGEPFRTHDPAEPAPDLAWFESADANHDARITLAEFRADASRFFALLDVNKDGEIDPQEIDRYETQIAPEIRSGMTGFGGDIGAGPGNGGRRRRGGGMGGGRGRGGMGGGFGGGDARPSGGGMPTARRGAGRFGYFDLPEPVIAADTNLNRGVSAKEFDDAAIKRFGLLDTAHQGYLTRDTLPKLEREGGPRRGGARPSNERVPEDPGTLD